VSSIGILSESVEQACFRSVSLLTDFEDVNDPFDWTVGEHGIHIHFGDPAGQRGGKTLSATYLPDVASEQGWDKTETLDSAMRKAGYR
jgi:AMMECR1 domain-containing protein